MFSEMKKEVNTFLLNYFENKGSFNKVIYDSASYSLNIGGKRIRPLLMLLTYNMYKENWREILEFSSAIEMIHTYSLVHDDLPAMDNDMYRRGKKTTHAVYGEDMGILAGDGLLNMAYETMSMAILKSKYPQRAALAMNILAYKAGIYGMIGGQVVDVELTGKPIPQEKLDFIYRLKTGALLEASMMIGAVLAGADEEEIALTEQIASAVGLAFQIQDDILDVTSSQEVLGKPVLSDEKNNKTTYVTLEGIEKSKHDVKQLSETAVDILYSLPGKNEFLEELIEMLVSREK